MVSELTEAIQNVQELESLPEVVDLWGGLREVPGKQAFRGPAFDPTLIRN